MKTGFGRSFWSKPVIGLAMGFVLGCAQAVDPEASNQSAGQGVRHIEGVDPVLARGRVLDPRELERAPDIGHLRFEPGVPEIRGGLVIISGELINPGDAPALVYISGLPFTLMPRIGNGISWRQNCNDPCCMPEIPAPPPNTRFTLPPRSSVTFRNVFDLCRIQYSGAPDLQFNWSLNLLTRLPEKGAVTVRLPIAP